MNIRKVKIFETDNAYSLEKQLNTLLQDTSIRIESIEYSTRKDAYSALVLYRHLLTIVDDKHKTEPLAQ